MPGYYFNVILLNAELIGEKFDEGLIGLALFGGGGKLDFQHSIEDAGDTRPARTRNHFD